MTDSNTERAAFGLGLLVQLVVGLCVVLSCGPDKSTDPATAASREDVSADENRSVSDASSGARNPGVLQAVELPTIARSKTDQGVASKIRIPLSTADTATVVIFVRTDCPISNRYAPELARLEEEFDGGGVGFVTAYVDPDVSEEALQEHLVSYSLPGRAVVDAEHRLAQELGATVTPEAVVLSAEGQLLYRGRIDNRYVTFGQARPHATERDLFRVLQALSAGEAVEFAQTEAVGCFIADLKGAI